VIEHKSEDLLRTSAGGLFEKPSVPPPDQIVVIQQEPLCYIYYMMQGEPSFAWEYAADCGGPAHPPVRRGEPREGLLNEFRVEKNKPTQAVGAKVVTVCPVGHLLVHPTLEVRKGGDAKLGQGACAPLAGDRSFLKVPAGPQLVAKRKQNARLKRLNPRPVAGNNALEVL
jgi:hypothetical protein